MPAGLGQGWGRAHLTPQPRGTTCQPPPLGEAAEKVCTQDPCGSPDLPDHWLTKRKAEMPHTGEQQDPGSQQCPERLNSVGEPNYPEETLRP